MKLALLVPIRRGARAASGGDIYDAELVAALARRGHDAALVPTRPGADPVRMARQLLAAGYDALVQDELGHAPYLALNRALSGRLPVYALVHVTNARLAPEEGSAAAERAYLQSVRGAVFVSRHVQRETRKLLAVTTPGLVVPPGAAAPRPPRPRPAGRTLRCLSVAHLLPHKSQLALIELFARLPLPATLVLAGDDACDRRYAQQVRRAAAQLPPGRVRVVGVLDRAALRRAYAAADVCVSASHYESYGMALADALTHGLPVVSWTVGGLWEFLEPGVSALRVRPGDRAGFAAALTQLAEDPRLRARLQRGARSAARQLPTWDDAALRLETWLMRSLRAAA